MFSPKARPLILASEGVDQPKVWPGLDSGITIGIGYDLSSVTRAEFAADWQAHLSPSDFSRLVAVVGLRGEAARKVAPSLAGIIISREQAELIFDTIDVPHYSSLTRKTFPNSDRLPPDTFGALVSLVFNRGANVSGDRRAEMAAIVSICRCYGLIAQPDASDRNDALRAVACQLRSMVRLWRDSAGVDGLRKRREDEAVLVESCCIAA